MTSQPDVDVSCRCKVVHEPADLRDIHATLLGTTAEGDGFYTVDCSATATQEDGLCDNCRGYHTGAQRP